MNKERMLALADFLEDQVEESRFDMNKWLSYFDEENEEVCDLYSEMRDVYFVKEKDDFDCNTTACIAGWAVLYMERYDQNALRTNYNDEIFNVAAQYLGLTLREARQLFYIQFPSLYVGDDIDLSLWSRYFYEIEDVFSDDIEKIQEFKPVQVSHAIEMLRNLVSGKYEFLKEEANV
jgi:hypothetical protein